MRTRPGAIARAWSRGPLAFKASGVSHSELVDRLIRHALARASRASTPRSRRHGFRAHERAAGTGMADASDAILLVYRHLRDKAAGLSSFGTGHVVRHRRHGSVICAYCKGEAAGAEGPLGVADRSGKDRLSGRSKRAIPCT